MERWKRGIIGGSRRNGPEVTERSKRKELALDAAVDKEVVGN